MKIEFTYRFEAAHRFLNTDSKPCMTPHGHSWYVSLVLKYKAHQLNSSQMTVEFSSLKKDWRELIQNTFDHSFMHHFNDPIVEVLNQGQLSPRLIPFPGDPTTEIIAIFLFHKLKLILNHSPHSQVIDVDSIILQETPTNKIICENDFYQSQISQYKKFDGWWNSTDVKDRSFRAL